MAAWRLRSVAWALALCAAPVAARAADAPPPELIVGADVRIGTDGTVSDYHLDGTVDHALADRIEQEVRRWHFAPVLRDGQPVTAKTRLLISLQPAAEWNHWTIADVSTGEPALAKRELLMPDYPESALRAHLSARVLLDVKLDARGKVEAVHVEQTSLDRPGDPKLAKQWAEIFGAPSVRAAKGWKFLPPESVDGQAVGTTIRIAIVFPYDIDNLRTHRFYPGAVTPAPWLPQPAGDDAQRDALADGGMQALDARVRLADDVVGRTL
jgi:TonB family protein